MNSHDEAAEKARLDENVPASARLEAAPHSRLRRARQLAWLPIPLLLALIAGLWVADLHTVYESRMLMVLLNLLFTWLASLCICFMTARGFLASGRPGLLMFGCGSLLWGFTSLVAAAMVDHINPTITVHNLGVFGAAFCHFVGVLWTGRLSRQKQWLAAGYSAALAVSVLIVWAATTGRTPIFFMQGSGGTPARQLVLMLAVAMFAWVAWQMVRRFWQKADTFYYWYGLGLALVATGLTGVLLLSVQGGILGWTNRLTQYLGSAYLFVAALAVVRETAPWAYSISSADKALQEYWFVADSRTLRQQWPMILARYGIAVIAVFAGFGARLALEARFGLGLPPYFTFYPAILLVALLAGLGPCLLAIALSLAVARYWILPSLGHFVFESPTDRLGLVVFASMGLFMGVLAELYRRTRDRIAAYDREAAVRESQSRLETVFSVSPTGIFITRLADGLYLEVNDAYLRLIGYSAEETIGRTSVGMNLWVNPGDRDKIVELVRAKDRVDSFETRLRRKTGEVVDLLVSALPLERGGETCILGTLTDITKRKRAEEALQQSEAFKQVILNSLPSHIAVLDHAGRVVSVNHPWMQFARDNSPDGMAGLTVGADYLEVCRRAADAEEPLAREAFEGIQSVLEGNCGQFALEYPCHGPTEQRWFLMTVTPTIDTGGAVIAHTNITKRKTAEEAVLRAKEEWEQTFDSVPDLIAVLDENHRVVRANRPMAEHLGVTPEECVGLPCYRVVHGTDAPPSFCPHSQTLADCRQHTTEVHEARLGGDYLVSTIPMFSPEGRLTGSIHLARNITERKQAEREREAIIEFLRLVNEVNGTVELLEAATRFFHERSGCEAVGIRFKEGDDYPYHEARGFPEEFIRTERSLCARDAAGQPVRDANGYPIMECMCGNVIQGRFDPSKPFFTARGSFWSNGTTELLATSAEEDRQARTRNRCNGEGYESVALIALRVGEDCLGLLQLNDKRKNQFTPQIIALWERLADYLAVALAKNRAEEALQQSEKRLETLVNATFEGIAVTEEGRYVDANEQLLQILGHSREELIGREVGADIPLEDRERIVNAIREGRTTSAEHKFIRSDGKVIDVEVHGRTVDYQNRKVRLTAIRDVTERRQVEAVQAFLAQTGGGTEGESFFDALARYLAQNLGMDFICIDRLEGDGLTASTLSVWCDGRFEDNVSYALKDTPCGEVVGNVVCCFPASVCQYFPRD